MWRLWDSLADFDVAGERPEPGEDRLRLNGATLLLREPIAFPAYHVSLEVAFAGPEGFAGIVFAARDAGWHELVYLSPGGEVQYDPVMNGSNTWQVYPELQGDARWPGGGWARLRLQVRPEGVAAWVDDTLALIVRSLRGGGSAGRVGVWGYLPVEVRNLDLAPASGPLPPAPPDPPLPPCTVATWRLPSGGLVPVEPNGVLNLNRHLAYAEGAAAEVRSAIVAPEAGDAILTLGYSDRLRLWLNGEQVHEGVHRWDPPRADGRILPAAARIPVRLKAGVNELVARVAADEPFGWGLAVAWQPISARRPARSPAS